MVCNQDMCKGYRDVEFEIVTAKNLNYECACLKIRYLKKV